MRHLPILIAALLAASPALAENRGVVIANGRYEHAPEVEGVDGNAASEAMKAAGFRTVAGNNLIIGDVRQAIADLLRPDETPGARIVLLNGRFLTAGRDSWFMGSDADKPDVLTAGTQGVSLGAIADLLGGADPGAVLLLGSDGEGMEHAEGLENGIGTLTAPEGVTVISGPPEAAAAAATALLTPGTSVGEVVKADSRLSMADGGNADLVLLEAVASNAPEAPAVAGTSEEGVATEGDRDLWARAAAEDTAEAYQNYLTTYPTGLYSAAASARLGKLGVSTKSDRDLWAEAAATDSREAYESYLGQYPKGEFAEAAQRRVTEMRLAEDAAAAPEPEPMAEPEPAPVAQPKPAAPRVVAPTRTPEIQQPRVEALRAQPGQGTEANLGLSRGDRVTIQRRLNALGYSTGGTDGVFGARTRSAIRGWQQRNGLSVTGYLTGNQVALLRNQAGSVTQSYESQDRQYWQRTGARGGISNLRAYLERYPNGIYAQTARNRLQQAYDGQGGTVYRNDREDIAWNRARQNDTVQSYTTYLRNWPRGEHASQARQRRDRLIRSGNIGNQGMGGGVINPESIIRDLLR